MLKRMGPQSSGQARPTDAPQVHAAQHLDTLPAPLADVALIKASQCASAAGLSLTTWYELVQRGDAPQPAFRGPRCTRWRLAEVRDWLIEFAKRGLDTNAAQKGEVKERNASRKVAEQRRAVPVAKEGQP